MNILETTFDKFIFRVKTDCLYTRDDFWARVAGNVATVGIADFRQKNNGDVTVLDTVPPGTAAKQGEELGIIETIKATARHSSPVTGKVIEVNSQLALKPFLINDDPYGTGWIYRIELADLAGDRAGLLDATAYFALLERESRAGGEKASWT